MPFRNALIPVVTMLGIQIGFLLSGAVLVEVVFTWPGLGRYAVESVVSFDFYAVIGAALVIAVDLCRLKYSRGSALCTVGSAHQTQVNSYKQDLTSSGN